MLKGGVGTNRIGTQTILLLFVAALLLAGGVFNLRDRLLQKPIPTDGAFWRDEAGTGVIAAYVEPGSPAARAGVYTGDVLVGVCVDGSGQEFEEITEARHVQLILDQMREQIDDAHPLSYWVIRRNATGGTIREGVADLYALGTQGTERMPLGIYLAIIGLIYLGIGVYFMLRQARAPYVTHFFLICICGFIAHFFSPTAELRTQFDKTVDFADTAALLLIGPLLIHFAAIYPSRDHLFRRRRWLVALLYLPAVALIVVQGLLRVGPARDRLPISGVNLYDLLERGGDVLFAVSLLVSCVLFLLTFRRTPSIMVRQQLKWIAWGVGVAALVFTAFYIPSRVSSTPQAAELLTAIAIAPLILIPLTMGYSIIRYRLMDVDILVRRSVAYIVATLSVALLFGSVMAVSLEFLRAATGATLLITAITLSAIAMLFAPMKNWVQQRIDRMFYGEKYDYRMTLQ
ncbi:MAG: hypothetical protein ACKV2V_25075, partial [Blastocatellia bacterium]